MDSKAVMPESLLGPEEVAGWLGVPIPTLYAWRSRGDGPAALKVGRHLRYRRQDVERWLERQAEPDAAA